MLHSLEGLYIRTKTVSIYSVNKIHSLYNMLTINLKLVTRLKPAVKAAILIPWCFQAYHNLAPRQGIWI